MKRDYKKLLESGNKAQLEKLEQNNHKRGFDDIDFNYALRRLDEERAELGDAIFTKKHEEIRHEAADIANFAHMIILQCDNEMNKKETK